MSKEEPEVELSFEPTEVFLASKGLPIGAFEQEMIALDFYQPIYGSNTRIMNVTETMSGEVIYCFVDNAGMYSRDRICLGTREGLEITDRSQGANYRGIKVLQKLAQEKKYQFITNIKIIPSYTKCDHFISVTATGLKSKERRKK